MTHAGLHNALSREAQCKSEVEDFIRRLPDNLGIDRDFLADTDDSTAEDVVLALNEKCRAEFNNDGSALPAADAGADPKAGTNSIATCVAVLGRATYAHGCVVGCTHLSETDMATVSEATISVKKLLVRMAAATGTPFATLPHLYLVGGQVTGNDTYQEFARLIAGTRAVVDVGAAVIAGAWLPANDAKTGLAVFIDKDGVYVTRDEHDSNESD
jgi:hypothetical protein